MKTTINDDIVPVSQFLAESQQNIEIASAIYGQYVNAREEIVRGFFTQLSRDLKVKLPGWTCRYDEPFFIDRYGAFDLMKDDWNERYRVRVEAYNWGDGMGYGVWRDASSLGSLPRSDELLSAVRKRLPQATSRPWYEAEIPMNSPSKDWRTPSTLWRMHSDKTFRAEVAALLLEIVELAEEHIDTLARKAKRRNAK